MESARKRNKKASYQMETIPATDIRWFTRELSTQLTLAAHFQLLRAPYSWDYQLAAVITTGLLLLYIPLCYEDFHFHVAHMYAHLGYPNAQHILGQRYLQGAGVKKNEDMAMHWFRQAAGQGHPHSSFNLAVGTLRNMTGSGETPQCGSSPRAPRSSATFGKHLQEQKPSLSDCCNTDARPTLPPSALSNPTFSLLGYGYASKRLHETRKMRHRRKRPGGAADSRPARKRSRLQPSSTAGTLQREPIDLEESSTPALEPGLSETYTSQALVAVLVNIFICQLAMCCSLECRDAAPKAGIAATEAPSPTRGSEALSHRQQEIKAIVSQDLQPKALPPTHLADETASAPKACGNRSIHTQPLLVYSTAQNAC
ncbi:hypothetical protein IHE44_0013252 [Lamprotornis superbus]|uniref:Uncharacterized protein n=1 Tax=Lamprotornis superbus TaxID=245042 RepID=A0A835NJ41_9PASS|nr:hypothetical protein IHE44_0013252 [Lamprotornis superbus]